MFVRFEFVIRTTNSLYQNPAVYHAESVGKWMQPFRGTKF